MYSNEASRFNSQHAYRFLSTNKNLIDAWLSFISLKESLKNNKKVFKKVFISEKEFFGFL